MLLELTDVNVHYGKIHALKNISLAMPETCIVSLIGANGAGKSSTLRVISGLTLQTSGEVSFLGKKIGNLPLDRRVEMGIVHVPEGRRIFADLTVQENLNMGAYTRTDKSAVKKDLEKVFHLFPVLADRKYQKGANMSGGEQQMLAVGRGLMAGPKLLLLDEPSLGLAPLMIKKVSDIIKKVNHEGTAILLVEQNAAMALKLSQIAYVLETGRIILHNRASLLLRDERVREAYLGG